MIEADRPRLRPSSIACVCLLACELALSFLYACLYAMAALATALSPRLELGSRARAAPRAAVPAPPLPRVVPVIKSEDGRERFILPTVTPEAEVHESGWTVKVDLEGAGSARRWRSGQSLRGKVTVQPQEGLKQQTVHRSVDVPASQVE